MILHCPRCGNQHIDRDDGQHIHPHCSETVWRNPPHRSHLCRPEDGGCGHIWRPADVPTTGVARIQTKGKADSAAPAAQPLRDEVDKVWHALKRRGWHPGRTDDTLSACVQAVIDAAPIGPFYRGRIDELIDATAPAAQGDARDAARLDWLEKQNQIGIDHIAYGDYRYYAGKEFKPLREVIDAAMKERSNG